MLRVRQRSLTSASLSGPRVPPSAADAGLLFPSTPHPRWHHPPFTFQNSSLTCLHFLHTFAPQDCRDPSLPSPTGSSGSPSKKDVDLPILMTWSSRSLFTRYSDFLLLYAAFFFLVPAALCARTFGLLHTCHCRVTMVSLLKASRFTCPQHPQAAPRTTVDSPALTPLGRTPVTQKAVTRCSGKQMAVRRLTAYSWPDFSARFDFIKSSGKVKWPCLLFFIT